MLAQNNAPDGRGGAELPLLGFRRLYETQLRSERKSPKTLEAYDYALGKFETWFSHAYGGPPADPRRRDRHPGAGAP